MPTSAGPSAVLVCNVSPLNILVLPWSHLLSRLDLSADTVLHTVNYGPRLMDGRLCSDIVSTCQHGYHAKFDVGKVVLVTGQPMADVEDVAVSLTTQLELPCQVVTPNLLEATPS